MTEPALRSVGRTAAHSALRYGGARVARLDRRPRARRVLLRALPHAIPRWFDADAARGLEATFELRIPGRDGENLDRWAVKIYDGRCTVSAGAASNPGATVTIAADELIRVASGDVGWPELLSTSRLELAGDPFLALRFPSLFRLPAHSR
jgi:hypothetical protein